MRTPNVRHVFLFFFFNDTATTEIYTLSLHDALPIYSLTWLVQIFALNLSCWPLRWRTDCRCRSEEHTSELQSQSNLVCRLLLEKKKRCPHRGRTRAGAPVQSTSAGRECDLCESSDRG